jgi:ATP-dependent RNA helicase RhlE
MPFSRFGLYSSILRAVQGKGYTTPTPVQSEAIPVVLSGRDLVAAAQTGTGKTAAFALPILNRLGPHRAGGARVLVLEPTRELAAQVAEAFREFAQFTDLQVTLIQGGVGYGKQRNALVDGADIVVATVGRLLELIDDHAVQLGALQVLVLDEVDRMLDMGFIEGVQSIVGRCPRQRQTLLFSATVPAAIEEVARFALREPVRLNIGRVRTVPETVRHALYPVPPGLKFPLLLALLAQTEFRSLILFTRTKEGADGILARLKRAGHSVTVLHGDRSTGQRKAAMAGFKDGYYRIMVATDIAARGLDLSEVSHVINYDIPLTPDDYVHRVGRTGRAEATGEALTLFTPRERGAVQAIERFIRAEIPQKLLPGFDYKAVPPRPEPGEGVLTTLAPKTTRPKRGAEADWCETTVGPAKKKRPPAAAPAAPSPRPPRAGSAPASPRGPKDHSRARGSRR